MFYGRWTFPMEEGVFQGPAGWKPLVRSRSYFAQLILSVRPCNDTNIMAIAPGVSPPQYGEFVAFGCLFNFSKSSAGRTGRPILKHNGSNDAPSQKKVPFGGYNDKNFHLGVNFPPRIQKLVGLAGNRKIIELFRAYLHEGSTDKHQSVTRENMFT
jgi:hypothetical protein